MARNILLIIIDQFRADLLTGSLADNINLPNMRRLMAQGTVFTNHFTVVTPCGPSRASLLTGQYAMNHRSIRNGTPLAAHHPTLGTEARRAGREPLLFGYTDTSADPSARHPNDPDLRNYEGLAPGFAEIVRMRFEARGSWQAYLKRKGYDLPDNHWELFRPIPQNKDNATQINDPALYRAEDSDTAFLTDRTMEELSVREDAEGWFATVTYIRPHPPFVAPAPYNRMYDPADVPPPVRAAPLPELRNSHPFHDAFHAAPSNHGVYIGFDGNIGGMPDADTATLRAVYFGLATEVDAHIGRLLDWLDDTGQARKTTVVLTADHGEMLGDHHIWGKNAPHDGALHIPLIIRDPDLPGHRRIDAMTESVDVAPTLLDMMGVPSHPAMNGRSLGPFLSGETPADWRDHIFAEIDLADPAAPTRFERSWSLPAQSCNYAVIRDRHVKYVHFNGGIPPMLFDLATDPGETTNLAPDPAYRETLERMRIAMIDHRMRHAQSSHSFQSLTSTGPQPPFPT